MISTEDYIQGRSPARKQKTSTLKNYVLDYKESQLTNHKDKAQKKLNELCSSFVSSNEMETI